MKKEMTVSQPDDDSGKPFPDTERCRESFFRTLMPVAMLLAVLFGAYELYGKIPARRNSSSTIREITLASWNNNASLSANDALDAPPATSLRFNFSQIVRDLLKQQNIGNCKQEVQWNDESSPHYLLQRKSLSEPSDFGISSYRDDAIAFQISSILRNITPARAGPFA